MKQFGLLQRPQSSSLMKLITCHQLSIHAPISSSVLSPLPLSFPVLCSVVFHAFDEGYRLRRSFCLSDSYLSSSLTFSTTTSFSRIPISSILVFSIAPYPFHRLSAITIECSQKCNPYRHCSGVKSFQTKKKKRTSLHWCNISPLWQSYLSK